MELKEKQEIKEYKTPLLKVLGDVRELTKAEKGSGDDGDGSGEATIPVGP